MIKKLLPILLIVIGISGGVGAGVALRPAPEDIVVLNPCGEAEHQVDTGHSGTEDPKAALDTREYVKLNNQFVVPVVEDEKVTALVVMSLSVEVGPGQKESVYEREPKLRDSFLQVLFDHANMGGFRGAFTSANNMDVLRRSLNEVAKKLMGGVISDVLIIDIARQDI